jgi:23S rRNA (uracil1939-C5)-methyltransferase
MKLRIDKPIYGGAGLGRAAEGELSGKTVFVPMTLPGEIVEVHVTDNRRSFANAELDSVLEPAPGRTEPACSHFGVCGGCQYQHAIYLLQLEMKKAILRETLERAHISDIPEIASVYGEPLAYRNRIRLHCQRSPFAIGYHRRGSHAMLPIRECPIAAPLLEQALHAMQRVGGRSGLATTCDEIEFFTNAAQDALMLSLWTARPPRDAARELEALSKTLQCEVPALIGAGLYSSPQGKQQARLLAGWGSDSLTYSAAGFGYRVSLGSFFQVNRFLVDSLVSLVMAEQSGSVAWDLYAGVGLFARALDARYAKVIAVEAAASFSDLEHNLSGTAHTAIRATTLDFLKQQVRVRDAQGPELVVVDPPRTGLGSDVTSLLATVEPPRILYVSCDPATLSRDLHALLQSGYTLQNIHLVDLFPQTFHMESVTVLTRG